MTHKEQLKAAIKRGLEMARDPQNAGITDLITPRVTTIDSWWYRRVCPRCHHTFREGDLVLPHPHHAGQMLHEDHASRLLCASSVAGLPIPAPPDLSAKIAVRTAFLDALHQYWHPDKQVDYLTVVRNSPYIGRKCPICSHTVRRGDMVVVCPCGNNCGGVFHQDITRHLTCWDTWKSGTSSGQAYCPFTGSPARITDRQDA